MGARHMLVAGQRVADQDRVGFRRVERPVRLVGDLQRPKIDAGVHFQRFVSAETRDGGYAGHSASSWLRAFWLGTIVTINLRYDTSRSL